MTSIFIWLEKFKEVNEDQSKGLWTLLSSLPPPTCSPDSNTRIIDFLMYFRYAFKVNIPWIYNHWWEYAYIFPVYVVNKSKTHKYLSKITETSLLKKGHLPLLLSPETDRILFRNPSNNIPKIILMIDDPVIDLPSSLFSQKTKRTVNLRTWIWRMMTRICRRKWKPTWPSSLQTILDDISHRRYRLRTGWLWTDLNPVSLLFKQSSVPLQSLLLRLSSLHLDL